VKILKKARFLVVFVVFFFFCFSEVEECYWFCLFNDDVVFDEHFVFFDHQHSTDTFYITLASAFVCGCFRDVDKGAFPVVFSSAGANFAFC